MGQKMYANILTIAGSDSGGGAGIQADLKAISATGAYGLSVITALTAQNTVGVDAIYPVAIDFLKQQMQTVARDIHIDAVKIGMLGTPEVTEAVAAFVAGLDCPLVIDPVMVAKSGDRLLHADAIASLRDVLIPKATLITPNLPEAADLLGLAEEGAELGHRELVLLELLGSSLRLESVGGLASELHAQAQRHEVDDVADHEAPWVWLLLRTLAHGHEAADHRHQVRNMQELHLGQ